MVAFSFASAIDNYVEQRQSIHPADQRWHPSGIYGCARQAIYSYRDTPETNPRDAKSKRTMWLGTQIHTWLQDAVSQHPDIIKAYSEVHIDVPELNLVGDADVLYLTESGWELGEVKSIKAMALKYAKELPKPDHRMQALTYLWALRTHGSVAKEECTKHESPCPVVPPLGNDLDRVCFAYVGKDDLGPVEVSLDWKPEFEGEIRRKIDELSGYALDPASLPPRLPLTSKGVKDWRCGYCPFMDKCWNQDPTKVDPTESIW